ncbi:SWI/SNF complex 60 kDa subunit [Irpex lacteus]|nr:SWI/SNF complex 60 kDa subunit [Irpex lacteus]
MQKPAKRRKLTDKNVPNAILHSPEFSVDSQMYQDLLNMEKRLDWTMTRKRVEIQDTLGRPMSTNRTLRIFLSHTVSGQPWQQGSVPSDGNVNIETGEGIPAFQFKVEGRLLEIPNQRAKDRVPPRKFSTLVRQLVVELDRDPAQYPDSNTVEWIRSAQNFAPLDGFAVRRRGDSPTRIRVVIHLEQHPEHFKIHPELGNILGLKEETRTGVIQAVWNYIKLQDLQDKIDRRTIRPDAALRPIFGTEPFPFRLIPERVNRYLARSDPIVLHYTLDPSQPPPEKPVAYDVDIRVEDTSLKSRMSHVVMNMAPESAKELSKLDDEISLHVQSLQNSHLKRTFLQSFASNPRDFIQTWLESQSRDLEAILGSGPSEGATLRQDDLRRSEYFRLPWVEEAVAIQEGMRLAAKTGLAQQ